MLDTHLPVLIETLEPTESLPFPLYLQLGDALILFRTTRDRLGEDDISQLHGGEKTELYTPIIDSKGYLPLLRGSFEKILSEPGDPAVRLRDCARRGVVATEHIIRNTEAQESHGCAQAFVGALVHILEECAFRFSATAGILESHPNLAEHSVHVCVQGLLLGRFLELPDLEELGVSLLLHDVGLLGVDEEDTDPRTENPIRRARYEEHPLAGARMLSRAPWLTAGIRDVVLNHHERIDGSGFPRGLREDRLTPAVRLAGIVDTFDRRSTGRTGGKPRGTFEVLQEMVRKEEGIYDSGMLQALVGLLAD